jgi:transcriptional regulator with XRE-family HTH domain
MKKSVHSEPYSVFAALLVSARKRAGMRQIELAQKLSKPQSFVSKFECGERRLDVIEFLTITDALGADPLAILSEAAKALKRVGVRPPIGLRSETDAGTRQDRPRHMQPPKATVRNKQGDLWQKKQDNWRF